jgi:hypothetical protein
MKLAIIIEGQTDAPVSTGHRCTDRYARTIESDWSVNITHRSVVTTARNEYLDAAQDIYKSRNRSPPEYMCLRSDKPMAEYSIDEFLSDTIERGHNNGSNVI